MGPVHDGKVRRRQLAAAGLQRSRRKRYNLGKEAAAGEARL